jgi:hypothetical protein
MTLESKPLTSLTEEAIQILFRELGVVDTVRFLRQYELGYGNYTSERRTRHPGETLDDLVDAIKQRRADNQCDSGTAS